MNGAHHPSIASMGKIAAALLASSASATVSGVTTRGIFLAINDDWVVFLSFEPYCGPLILNMTGEPGIFRNIEIHSRVRIEPGRLYFHTLNRELSSERAAIWAAPSPSKPMTLPGEYLSRAVELAELAQTGRNNKLLCAAVSGLSGCSSPQSDAEPNWLTRIARLKEAMAGRHAPAIVEALESCLGLGPGLTPAGDDLAAGILLTLNRYGQWLFSSLDIAAVNRSVVSAARWKTTTLSANLVICAAQGQADERLTAALDGIFSQEPNLAICARGLQDWGSSSGLDALAGMLIVLLAGSPDLADGQL